MTLPRLIAATRTAGALALMTMAFLACSTIGQKLPPLPFGADPKTTAAFRSAIEKKDNPKVATLIDKGARVNAPFDDGELPLTLAAARGAGKVIQTLLTNGANPNALNKNKYSPLLIASSTGSYKTVKALLDGGADVEFTVERDGAIISPLSEARSFLAARKILEEGAGASDAERIVILLEEAANEAKSRRAKLFAATELGDTKEVMRLVKKGALVNARNQEGLTPLMVAAAGGHVDIVKIFLGRHANIHLKAPGPFNALDLAIAEKQEPVVKLLQKRGAKPVAKPGFVATYRSQHFCDRVKRSLSSLALAQTAHFLTHKEYSSNAAELKKNAAVPNDVDLDVVEATGFNFHHRATHKKCLTAKGKVRLFEWKSKAGGLQ